jgi:hypothetical protein
MLARRELFLKANRLENPFKNCPLSSRIFFTVFTAPSSVLVSSCFVIGEEGNIRQNVCIRSSSHEMKSLLLAKQERAKSVFAIK